MPQIARKGDICDHAGAPIDSPAIANTVFVNGIEVAINNGGGTGSKGPCGLWSENDKPSIGDDTHPLGRSGTDGGFSGPTGGSPSVFVGGIPVHRFRDSRGCGAETTTASPNVWADEIEQLSIPGATVQQQQAGPLAPSSLTFLFENNQVIDSKLPLLSRAVFVFTSNDSSNGNIQTRKFYRVRPGSVGKSWKDLDSSDFKLIGDTLNYKLLFKAPITGFEEKDIDLASKDNIPFSEENSGQNFVAGIPSPDFPSFGQNQEFSSSFKIPSTGSLVPTWKDFASYTCGPEGDSFQWTSVTGAKYKFNVANESGNVDAFLSLIVIPYVPSSYRWQQTLCNAGG